MNFIFAHLACDIEHELVNSFLYLHHSVTMECKLILRWSYLPLDVNLVHVYAQFEFTLSISKFIFTLQLDVAS